MLFRSGKALSYKRTDRDIIFIDTIGEGAGVYSRLVEQGIRGVFSVKNSQGAKGLHDITGEYSFANILLSGDRLYFFAIYCVVGTVGNQKWPQYVRHISKYFFIRNRT